MRANPVVSPNANRAGCSSRAVLLPSNRALTTPWGCNAAQRHDFRHRLARKFRAERGGVVTFPSLDIRSRRGTSLAEFAGDCLDSARACGGSQARGRENEERARR